MELPKRKPHRMKEYDYSSTGAYFITLCTKNRRNLFWNDVGASIARPRNRNIELSKYGKIVENAVQNISVHYPAVLVDKYVIMPNHVHLLLQIKGDQDGRPMVAPTISTVVQQMKGHVTKQAGFPLWQKLFYDHVVRGEGDYREICEYIDSNPLKWKEDHFFSAE